jgi:hypothetical protein
MRYSSYLNNIQAFPNPFNESVVIQFDSDSPAEIFILICDFVGKPVYNTSVKATPGINTLIWNVKDNSGNVVAKGIYIINLSCGSTNDIVKVFRL